MAAPRCGSAIQSTARRPWPGSLPAPIPDRQRNLGQYRDRYADPNRHQWTRRCFPSSNPPVAASRIRSPASGGLDPQTLDQVRQLAPMAFRTQERAVTPEDYGTRPKRWILRSPRRWGRSAGRAAGEPFSSAWIRKAQRVVSRPKPDQIPTGMELYRMAGHDVGVIPPVYVSLELNMKVCVEPGYIASRWNRRC